MDAKLKLPLKELLISACMGNYTNRHLQELYRLFYTIAHRLIRRRMFSSNFSLEKLGISETDATHDCIAELFILGTSNELAEIHKYFSYRNINIEGQSEDILFLHIRKLVFTVVNDNIFRLYNEADPALGKIIRNIKLALGKQSAFLMTVHFGEYYLELKTCNPLPGRPTMKDEDLQTEISSIITEGSDVPDILSKTAEMLTRQDHYRRHVKLISLAYAIRSSYNRQAAPGSGTALDVSATFTGFDTEQIIKSVCNTLKDEMMPRYINKKKTDEVTFTSYITAVERALRNEFVDGKNGDISYYEHLKSCRPDLTKEEYMLRHRVIIEYLGRIAKNKVREQIKDIL